MTDELRALDAFARELSGLRWFSKVGHDLTPAEIRTAQLYAGWLAQAGHPPQPQASSTAQLQASPAAQQQSSRAAPPRTPPVYRVRGWVHAKELIGVQAQEPKWASFEAAEQKRLLGLARRRHGDGIATAILDDFRQVSEAEVSGTAAIVTTQSGMRERPLAQAAGLAVAGACYAGALAMIAGEPAHPFTARLSLCRAGRWVVGPARAEFWLF